MRYFIHLLVALLIGLVCQLPVYSEITENTIGIGNLSPEAAVVVKDTTPHINTILPLFYYGLSYGTYQGSVTGTNTGGSFVNPFNASQPNIGIETGIKLPLTNMPNYYYLGLGYHYNFIADGLEISYFQIEAFGRNDDYYGGMGVNYSYWNKDINGGIGFQVFAGKPINDLFNIGVRYTSMGGKKSAGGYDNSYLINQLALDCRFNI